MLRQMPPAMPTYLRDANLEAITDDPIAWWVGQFMKYLLRPNPGMKKLIEVGNS